MACSTSGGRPVAALPPLHLRQAAAQLLRDRLQAIHQVELMPLLNQLLLCQVLPGRKDDGGVPPCWGCAGVSKQPAFCLECAALRAEQAPDRRDLLLVSGITCVLQLCASALPLALYRSSCMRVPSGIAPPLYLPVAGQQARWRFLSGAGIFPSLALAPACTGDGGPVGKA